MVKTQSWNSGKEIKSTILFFLLFIYEHNNIKTYKLYDIIFLFSGFLKKDLQQKLAITATTFVQDLYKEAADDKERC